MAGLSELVACGVDRVQVRERGLEGAALLALVDEVCEAVHGVAARKAEVIVNRFVDVALASAADGVHLGFDAVSAADARALMGSDRKIGVSCHSADEVGDATDADYAHLAPIHDPISKPAHRPALGLDALRIAASRQRVIAQGGIGAANAAACIAAGAAGIAVTGEIVASADPAAATRALRQSLDAA